ncbi:FAD-binding domain-containing protein [Zopfia rhizophila CBS 207.26]|uniref:FAD-binding domain-containing protein n=1 Tax=Zopfia rhizophila CBS 207.26 TaxID=1314779 RepID=A0A6A6DM55_9PEZI|nr:FAD-binding domain-containing protein [Zopfia rhizophila CBS 207.26]
MGQRLLFSTHVLLRVSAQVLVRAVAATNSTCRCIPSDPCWPSAAEWDTLNATVHGHLIKTTPVGHVCHAPAFDKNACALVKEKWDDPNWRTSIPESILSPSFANNSCDPFGHANTTCDLGGYAPYSLNITSPNDIAAGLRFADHHNIRVVVKNTGHDYLGRSVGFGGLSIWTHNLKDMVLIRNYTNRSYQGPAVKVGAGVQVLEAYEFVNRYGYMIVGGECQSVGLAGGYTSGGGQSPLSSFAGLAADQTLEFEVVTADGQFLRAAPDENQDLYWALSGGGPGYGVVWSVTYKVYNDVPVTGTKMSFSKGNISNETFWKAIDFWHSLAPNITDLGGYTYTIYSADEFSMSPLFAPNRTRSEVLGVIHPFHDFLDSIGIKYDSNTTTYNGFLDAWTNLLGQEGAGEGSHMGSRLLTRRALLETPDKTSKVLRTIVDQGASLLEMAIGAKLLTADNPDNAVNAAWRISDILLFTNGIDANSTGAGIDDRVTREWGDLLRNLTPESGTYMNEADVYEVDYQKSFYGENYGRLLSIKKRLHKPSPDR